MRDRERIKKNIAELKQAEKDAEKTKNFMCCVKDLMKREEFCDRMQEAADSIDPDALGDKVQFGYVQCDRSFIDKFLALKNKLKVKGMVFQTTMAYDVDDVVDENQERIKYTFEIF